jgi:hypothetical protein
MPARRGGTIQSMDVAGIEPPTLEELAAVDMSDIRAALKLAEFLEFQRQWREENGIRVVEVPI